MSRSPRHAKYDLRVNPVYQVDWQQEASGKHIAASKRRVKFRFGFSNREAIENGETGVNCRGEEHEVVLIWSLSSGKRMVYSDGKEVHFSLGKFTDNMFETSWPMAGGHIIKLIAHAAPPLVAKPGFRQFELFLDGLSFFDMPKIYELGTKKDNRSRHKSDRHFALPASDSGVVEEHKQSETPVRRKYHPVTPDAASTSRQEPVVNTPEMTRQQTSPEQYYAPVELLDAPFAHTAPIQTAPVYSVQTAPVYSVPQVSPQQEVQNDWWTQVQPAQDEFAPVAPPPPSFAEKSYQILSAYSPSNSYPAQNALPALTYTPHYAEYNPASPGAVESDVSSFEEESQLRILKLTMEPISLAEMEEQEAVPANEVDRAIKSLVNLDDITRTIETPEQVKISRIVEEKKKANKKKSTPMPPTAAQWHLGLQPTLEDIKKHTTPKEPKQEVMRTHAFHPAAAQAGMMVVYGAPMPYSQGYGQVQPLYNQQYPGNQYQGNQYAGNQYQANQYPGNQYQGNHYPGNQYQANQYPGNQYRANQYPGNQYQANQWSNSAPQLPAYKAF